MLLRGGIKAFIQHLERDAVMLGLKRLRAGIIWSGFYAALHLYSELSRHRAALTEIWKDTFIVNDSSSACFSFFVIFNENVMAECFLLFSCMFILLIL